MAMRGHVGAHALVAALLLTVSGASKAATYYVDASAGDDSRSGLSSSLAWRSVAKVNAADLGPGDSVLFRRGQTFSGELDVSGSGRQGEPITLGAWGTGGRPQLFQITLQGDYFVVEDILIDHQKSSSDAFRIRGGRNCILRRSELRNGLNDGVDVDKADGLLIEDVHIHHFLAGSFDEQADAHGIAATDTNGIVIRRADIHQVSGDSFQTDPDRDADLSGDVLIEDSTLWTSPLDVDFNAGWRAGDRPGENAIDTKVLQSGFENVPRMKLVVKNVVAYGWMKDSFINNKAVFNLKEKIDAILDGVTVSDSEIAFRVRGSLGNANVTIRNAVVYDVDIGIRAESDLANLVVHNSTWGAGIGEQLEIADGGGGTGTWDWRNNAFLGAKPAPAERSSNIVSTLADFVAANAGDYRLASGSDLIDGGETISSVVSDRIGKPRTAPYDVGAFESNGGAAGPVPAPPTQLRVDP
jgi:hypothetical protein